MGHKKTIKRLILVVILWFAGMKLITFIPAPKPSVFWNHKVYVAFGFHGNLYHSFRGDTNDESGFGRDIRVIRHIIRTLDRFNRDGVPVRAGWDFDNHFSLENLLPVHAPDILRDIRRRVDQGKDEVLVMSYNNGLASAMTRRELTDAVNWAVSNPWGSGVKDIFGTYTPVVRPQEMMTSPGNFEVYGEAGMQAVSLYYSATPFDTFRLFERELTPEEAHNPLTYENDRTGESILIIPTYNIGDLVENTSLGHWVDRLHRLQREGRINRDVLVYINFDADSEYWTGAAQLKWPLNQLPNTKGLEGLIREVKDRHYVRFTTLNDYLADHGPAGRVSFRQDTADGSFDGYNSWSEKQGTTDAWTRIMAARRIHAGAERALDLLEDSDLENRIRPLLDEAYLVRLKAMSTTNFGMATPFLAPQREKVMAEMLDRLDRLGAQIRRTVDQTLAARTNRKKMRLPGGWNEISPLLLTCPGEAECSGSRFLSLPLNRLQGLPAGGKAALYLRTAGGETWPLVRLPDDLEGNTARFYIAGRSAAPEGIYSLCTGPLQENRARPARIVKEAGQIRLESGEISLSVDASGRMSGVLWQGRPVLEEGSFTPWIQYKGARFEPDFSRIAPEAGPDGTVSITLRGTWRGSGHPFLSSGSVFRRYTLVPGLSRLFVDSDIRYPTTASVDVLKADVKDLAREMDLGWEETAPAELLPAGRTGRSSPVRILKTNYLGVPSSYALDYFRHSPENLNIDNANNHITPGLVGMAVGPMGLALGVDQSSAANFAGIPVRVRHDPARDEFTAAFNPFGTYHGRQHRRPSRGNGLGHEATLISGEQFHSAAPTFNGRQSRFSLMVGFFDRDQKSGQAGMPEALASDVTAWANPGMVFLPPEGRDSAFRRSAPSLAPSGYTVSMDEGRVTFSWESAGEKNVEYAVRMGREPGHYPHVFRTENTWLTLDGLSPHQPFARGQRYYAVIEASVPGHDSPERTREIRLDILDANHISARPRIPWEFSFKVIWASFKAAFL